MYSFDVFDTLITRRTATPTGLFTIVQYNLQKPEYCIFSKYLRSHFFAIRKEAEQQARHIYRSEREVTLDQIYSVISHACCLSLQEAEILKNIEIKAELEFTLAIDKNMKLLLDYFQHGEEVVLISDMYLDKNIICEILKRQNAVFSDLPIYVSSEHKCTKGTGLYYHVYEKEKNIFDDWQHIGDNIEVDVNIPRRIGITAEHAEFPKLLTWEKFCFLEDDIAWQLMCGASRNARIGKKERDAYDIGASIGAGILFPYVRWILKECGTRDIKHLFFVARDGYILQKIADCIIEKMHLDIQTSYIYGSRQSWRVPDITADVFNMKDFISANKLGGGYRLGDIATIFDLDIEELKQFLPVDLQDEKTVYKLRDGYNILGEYLAENASFISCIKNKLMPKQDIARSYLEQELKDVGDSFAFVEVQGTGRTQLSIQKLLEERYILTFYLKKSTTWNAPRCSFLVYVDGYNPISNFSIETLTRAPHGKTIAYRRSEENGKIVPILQDDENKLIMEYGYQDYIDGVMETVHNLLGLPRDILWDVDFDKISWAYLNYMSKKPDDRLLDYIGDMPFSDLKKGKEIVATYAPKFTEEDIRALYLYHNYDMSSYPGACFEYSRLRMTEEDRRKAEEYQACWEENRKKKTELRQKNRYQLNLDEIKSKIVLYAAGGVGRALYEQLLEVSDKKIVLWIDANADVVEKSRNAGLPVDLAGRLSLVQYDQIVIAVLYEDKALEIKRQLIKQGVPEGKIYWGAYKRIE